MIVLPAGAQVQPGAGWTVYLKDPSLAAPNALPIAQASGSVDDAAVMEIPFEMAYDAALIDPAATYVLRAVVMDAAGETVLYESALPVPVISGGAPTAGVLVTVADAGAGAEASASVASPMPSPVA
jgi:uncharacterized lipoprotein YbaY